MRSNLNQLPADPGDAETPVSPQYQVRSASGQTKVLTPITLTSYYASVRHGRPGDGSFEIGKITSMLSQQELDGQESAAP